jgi:hypothetical protein
MIAWVDHDQKEPTWAKLKERAILLHFAILATKGLQLALKLPKLHPHLETSALHYTMDGPQPPFPIDRKNDKGEVKVIHQKDFPL